MWITKSIFRQLNIISLYMFICQCLNITHIEITKEQISQTLQEPFRNEVAGGKGGSQNVHVSSCVWLLVFVVYLAVKRLG